MQLVRQLLFQHAAVPGADLKRDSARGWVEQLHPAGGVALAVGDGVAVHCLHLIDDHLHSKQCQWLDQV